MPPIGSGPEGLQKCAEEGLCFCGAQTKEEVTSPFSLSHSRVGKCDPGMVRDGMGECGGSNDCWSILYSSGSLREGIIAY